MGRTLIIMIFLIVTLAACAEEKPQSGKLSEESRSNSMSPYGEMPALESPEARLFEEMLRQEAIEADDSENQAASGTEWGLPEVPAEAFSDPSPSGFEEGEGISLNAVDAERALIPDDVFKGADEFVRNREVTNEAIRRITRLSPQPVPEMPSETIQLSAVPETNMPDFKLPPEGPPVLSEKTNRDILREYEKNRKDIETASAKPMRFVGAGEDRVYPEKEKTN